MLDCETVINFEVQKAMVKKPKLIAIFSFIVGLLGLCAYIVLFIMYDSLLTNLLLVFAFPFAFGLVLLLNINKNCKQRQTNDAVVNCYHFDNEHVDIISIKNNEIIGQSAISYKDIVHTKEVSNFLLLYVNKFSALPVSLKSLTSEQYIELKRLLNIK